MITYPFKTDSIPVLTLIFLLLGTFVLSSCASNRLLSSWTDPAMTDMKVEDVLVIGAFKDTTIRRLFENSFARGLQRENVQAFAGYSVEAVNKSVVYDTIIQATEATGAKTVLITRLVDVTSKTTTRDAVGRQYVDLEDAPIGPGMFYASPSISTSTNTRVKVQLESLLYDVPSRKLVWSARSELVDPVMTNSSMDNTTTLYIADLKNRDLL